MLDLHTFGVQLLVITSDGSIGRGINGVRFGFTSSAFCDQRPRRYWMRHAGYVTVTEHTRHLPAPHPKKERYLLLISAFDAAHNGNRLEA